MESPPPPPAVRINATKIQTADVQTRPRQEHRSRSELVARLINTNQLSCFQPKEKNAFKRRRFWDRKQTEGWDTRRVRSGRLHVCWEFRRQQHQKQPPGAAATLNDLPHQCHLLPSAGPDNLPKCRRTRAAALLMSSRGVGSTPSVAQRPRLHESSVENSYFDRAAMTGSVWTSKLQADLI